MMESPYGLIEYGDGGILTLGLQSKPHGEGLLEVPSTSMADKNKCDWFCPKALPSGEGVILPAAK